MKTSPAFGSRCRWPSLSSWPRVPSTCRTRCLFFGKAAWLNVMFPQTTLATVLVGHRAKTSRPYPMFCPCVGVTCGDPEVKGTPFPGQSCKGLHHPYKTDQMLQY